MACYAKAKFQPAKSNVLQREMADTIAIGCEIHNVNRRAISSPIVKEREQALNTNACSLYVPYGIFTSQDFTAWFLRQQ